MYKQMLKTLCKKTKKKVLTKHENYGIIKSRNNNRKISKSLAKRLPCF